MKYSSNKGMTLIEVILAMAIFGIIASGFLALFTSSLVWIFGAGDRGEAYSMAQSDVESSIAAGDAYATDDLEITFNGENYKIQGGLVESNQTVNQKNSTLKTFVPLLPTILLEPKVRYEGDQSTLIEIEGLNTSFNASTIVEVFDYSGKVKIGSAINIAVRNFTEVSFELPNINLINGDYIIRTVTNISGKPNQVSRARYTVSQPRFLIGGDDNVYVSADGIEWVNRDDFGVFPDVSNINSVIFNGNRYVLVTDSGQVIYSTEKQPWSIKISASEALNNVIWSFELGEFFAVGASGGIYKSGEDLNFIRIHLSDNEINSIAAIEEADGTDRLVAVGKDEILYSTNGYSWTSLQNDGKTLNDVAARAGLFVAVGDNVIGVSSNGTSWILNSSAYFLNDVTYLPGAGRFIAVGNGGVILSSSDGVSWVASSINQDISTIDLNGVHSRASVVIVVGNNGAVLFSNDYGANFELLEGLGITENLMSVSGE